MLNEASMIPSNPEAKNNCAKIFEHLFPRSEYNALPLFNPRNTKLLADLYTNREGLLNVRLAWESLKDREYAEREDISIFDKFTVKLKFGSAEPLNYKAQGAQIGGHSFGDLIDITKGEQIGGAVSKRIGSTNGLQVIIGIMDKDGKPIGLIHYVKGENPRQRKDGKIKNHVFEPRLSTSNVEI